ncbi:hypothetical protein GCM10007978_13480 [Shewanella hanedai]|nr:hypothetical protein GCM10007978_13480 [Shewanella hanedai]
MTTGNKPTSPFHPLLKRLQLAGAFLFSKLKIDDFLYAVLTKTLSFIHHQYEKSLNVLKRSKKVFLLANGH